MEIQKARDLETTFTREDKGVYVWYYRFLKRWKFTIKRITSYNLLKGTNQSKNLTNTV